MLIFLFEENEAIHRSFLRGIDFVTYFGLIGGETFLHPELEKCIIYLGENIKNRSEELQW